MMGQFGEVSIIEPLLRGIKKGFYVDVGAHDGVTDSNTLYFYRRGWRGVCVEPHKRYYQDLLRSRPGDRCLDVAVWRENLDDADYNASVNIAREAISKGYTPLDKEAEATGRGGGELSAPQAATEVAVKTLQRLKQPITH